MRRQTLIPILIVAVGLFAYHNSFRGAFIFDDLSKIIENERIRHVWPPWELLGHSSRPVVQFSLAVNYALGGLDPRGYHALNLTIHILAGLTLYGVVRRTLGSALLQSRYGEAASWLAGAVVLIWVVHPLQTESVTYTVQRCESLMGLLYLLTLYCVIRDRESSHIILWKAGAVISCALGMACKPVMVTAPVLVLLYDRVFLARSWRELMERRWGLHTGLMATWLMLPVLLANGPQDWTESAGFAYKGFSPTEYALTQFGVIVHYLRLSFWPSPLVIDYFGWPTAKTLTDTMANAMFVLILLVTSIWAFARHRALGFLGAWFFLILAPTSSFIPVADLAFEHRMYLPLAAVVAAVVFGIHRALLDWFPDGQQNGRNRQWLGAVMLIGVVTALSVLTVRRNEIYRSEKSIWADTAAKRPDNWRAHTNLAKLLAEQGRLDEAITHFRDAVRLEPRHALLNYNLGAALLEKGQLDDAIRFLREAVRLDPSLARAHVSWGLALQRQQQLTDAAKHFELAIQLDPNLQEAQRALENLQPSGVR